MKKITLFLLLMSAVLTGIAQPAKSSFLESLRQMQDAYRQPEYLSFDILYRYAPADQPDQFEDSISGNARINRNRFWYSLDNTESVNSGDLEIMVFREDKIVYLRKPVARETQAGGLQWIALLDSALSANMHTGFQVNEQPDCLQLVMEFAPDQSCRRIEYLVDRKTGWLRKMISIVKADQLYDPSVRSAIDSDQTYAVVETIFSNYSTVVFDTQVLDSQHYVRKSGDRYVCVGEYEQYSVFLGSAGL
ncbi:MAG: hypothetical protein P0Y53_10635 [Candidatus Pseudobacter hemicellulosilyticus]|uniref:Outer membrane lipoprotein-sorting protein n=1 Tax=Candidatus Pseudobacter hemicellulosilyticus TaxID=3121375 RepID=A0AAJ6BK12_9BACT|nr:MAG: hypothetical protein P0Y53_10635 [Pseudobacter sp.]